MFFLSVLILWSSEILEVFATLQSEKNSNEWMNEWMKWNDSGLRTIHCDSNSSYEILLGRAINYQICRRLQDINVANTLVFKVMRAGAYLDYIIKLLSYNKTKYNLRTSLEFIREAFKNLIRKHNLAMLFSTNDCENWAQCNS